ncbi:MAG: NAD(P)-dependent oxidoreductase [Deltaproteobacteria bacterium]|nr:NAD(P)-dependent oxidoreductase [Deltaproteobacteria bacterium]MBI3387191.1 NAD(P)-dependent oxidoreductase [Deltaproteobacteria bacterium]
MDLKGKNVAVTGATGFLGRYIVDVLLKRGAHVIGVVRNPDRVPELKRRGVELRKADLAERDHLATGFAGADAVVSNAALFSVRRLASLSRRNWEDHQRINIQGTRNVFEAVADSHVKRVVHVSSVAVYASRSGARMDEDHPQLSEANRPNPITAYAISKALSEQLAWRLAGELGLQLTTVRPCAIYGAFDPNFMAAIKWLLSLPVSVFPVMLHMPLVYAGDVAEAIALALEHPDSNGKAYNTTGDDHPISDFLQAWKEAGGKAPWCTLPLPVPVKQGFDHSRATSELGWRNRSYLEALRETVELERRAES